MDSTLLNWPDWVGTTLYGYTEDTAGQSPPGLSLLPELRQELKTSVRVVCGGNRLAISGWRRP